MSPYSELIKARNSIACHPVVEGDTLGDDESILADIALKTPVSCGEYVVITTNEVIVALGKDGRLYLNSSGGKRPEILSAITEGLPDDWSISDRWLVKSPSGHTWQFVDNMMIQEDYLVETDFGVDEAAIEREADIVRRAPRMISYYVSHIFDVFDGKVPSEVISGLGSDAMNGNRDEIMEGIASLNIDSGLIMNAIKDCGLGGNDMWKGIAQKKIRETLTRSLSASLKLPLRV